MDIFSRWKKQDVNNLTRARENAKNKKNEKMTQKDLADEMKVSQSVISKWEKNISTIPANQLFRLGEILGVSAESLLQSEPLKFSSWPNLQPYHTLDAKLSLYNSLFRNVDWNLMVSGGISSSITDLKKATDYYRRKPMVGIIGRFDAGKSALINEWLGEEVLPERYQPMTSLPTLVMHTDIKPTWMKTNEDVLVLDEENYNAIFWWEKPDSVVAIGKRNALVEFASHKGDILSESAKIAIVFIDNPVLYSCSIVDFPGFLHSEKDESLTKLLMSQLDVLIYTSPINGCMETYDRDMLANYLPVLPVIRPRHESKDGFVPYKNLIIAITRCDRDEKKDKVDGVINDLKESLPVIYTENTLPLLSDIVGQEITALDLCNRIVPFSIKVPERRNVLIDELKNILTEYMPDWWNHQAAKEIEGQKNTAIKILENRIADIDDQVNNKDHNEILYQHMKSVMSAISKLIIKSQDDLNEIIVKSQNQTISEFTNSYNTLMTQEAMTEYITKRFANEKNAKKRIGNSLSEHLKMLIQKAIQPETDQFAKVLDQKLVELNDKIKELLTLPTDKFSKAEMGDIHVNPVLPNFDTRVAFVSGLAGLGTLGALSAWASLVAAGSNLGAYILVAKISGLLAAAGIHVGGGAALVSLVSVLGGPVTVAIGLSVILAAAVFGSMKLFGPTWQVRMAKKIIEECSKNNILENCTNAIIKYWDATQAGTKKGMNGIRDEIESKYNELKQLVENFDSVKEELGRQKKNCQTIRSEAIKLPGM